MRAAMAEVPAPLARASLANWLFHASNPAGPLPHCAAPALPAVEASTMAAIMSVFSCPLFAIEDLPVHLLRSTLARRPGQERRDRAAAPNLAPPRENATTVPERAVARVRFWNPVGSKGCGGEGRSHVKCSILDRKSTRLNSSH